MDECPVLIVIVFIILIIFVSVYFVTIRNDMVIMARIVQIQSNVQQMSLDLTTLTTRVDLLEEGISGSNVDAAKSVTNSIEDVGEKMKKHEEILELIVEELNRIGRPKVD
jgi:uncharacterized protein YoxC